MKLTRISGLIVIGWLLTITSEAAQQPKTPPAPQTAGEVQDSEQTRRMLQGLLLPHPPSLREVLRLDHSLLTNEQFLAPYPNLVAFLGQHPEVLRNPRKAGCSLPG
jgi:hypothetical protein